MNALLRGIVKAEHAARPPRSQDHLIKQSHRYSLYHGEDALGRRELMPPLCSTPIVNRRPVRGAVGSSLQRPASARTPFCSSGHVRTCPDLISKGGQRGPPRHSSTIVGLVALTTPMPADAPIKLLSAFAAAG